MKEKDLQSAGPRPDGVPGLLIDEIELRGIWRTAKGYVAQVWSRGDRKFHLLRQDDELFDGHVVSIAAKEIVFKQVIEDPTAAKPFREVVITLSGA